jgi:hypothetical protein
MDNLEDRLEESLEGKFKGNFLCVLCVFSLCFHGSVEVVMEAIYISGSIFKCRQCLITTPII